MGIHRLLHIGGVLKRGPILEIFNKSGSSPLTRGVINMPNIGLSFKEQLCIISR